MELEEMEKHLGRITLDYTSAIQRILYFQGKPLSIYGYGEYIKTPPLMILDVFATKAPIYFDPANPLDVNIAYYQAIHDWAKQLYENNTTIINDAKDSLSSYIILLQNILNQEQLSPNILCNQLIEYKRLMAYMGILNVSKKINRYHNLTNFLKSYSEGKLTIEQVKMEVENHIKSFQKTLGYFQLESPIDTLITLAAYEIAPNVRIESE